jgi:hypothetical protein
MFQRQDAIFRESRYKILQVPAQYQCSVGICKTLYCRLPEDGALALKHVGILYVTLIFSRFV